MAGSATGVQGSSRESLATTDRGAGLHPRRAAPTARPWGRACSPRPTCCASSRPCAGRSPTRRPRPRPRPASPQGVFGSHLDKASHRAGRPRPPALRWASQRRPGHRAGAPRRRGAGEVRRRGRRGRPARGRAVRLRPAGRGQPRRCATRSRTRLGRSTDKRGLVRSLLEGKVARRLAAAGRAGGERCPPDRGPRDRRVLPGGGREPQPAGRARPGGHTARATPSSSGSRVPWPVSTTAPCTSTSWSTPP